MKIDIPAGAQYIIEELNRHGHEAYIVGGCVRDCLLGECPNDWDITTSAKPQQVKSLFKRTVDTGIQHGTVTVLVERNLVGPNEDYAYEVTTYRVDGEYKDHRRPDAVTFTASLEEDLKRRDFTINAMAYNDTDGLIDIFGGREDLENGVIRCVGEAAKRFDEDALRILRAVRFAAKLDFVIEEETKRAMKKQAMFLRDISAERICTELTKLITSDHPERLKEAYELGLTKEFLPEFDTMMQTKQNNPYHCYSVGEHTLAVMKHVPADVILRYTALLHDVGKPSCKEVDEQGVDHFYGHQEVSSRMAQKILRRLRMDNHTIDQVKRLVLYHDFGLSGSGPGPKAMRRFLSRLGAENFEAYLCIRKADMAGQSDYKLEERKKNLSNMEAMYKKIMKEGQCLQLSQLAITGRDLIAMGVQPGPQMGKILHTLFERVLDEPELNEEEKLKRILKEDFSIEA
ncbi:MAG: CCA tRNA nucleotidyltransferase [Wujia sp.]